MNPVDNLNQNELQAASHFIDTVLDLDLQTAIVRLQTEISQINTDTPSHYQATILIIIDTLWNFLGAFQIIGEKADFNQGIHYMTIANKGFEQLRHAELTSFSSALLTYYHAIIDIKSLNFQEGQNKIKVAKAEFDKLDKYKQRFGPMMEGMEAESFFISGTNMMMQQDMKNAQIAIHKASKGMKDLASKYYEVESNEYNYYMGIGRFFSIYGGFFDQISILNKFEFDHFTYADNDVFDESKKAIESLSRVMDYNELARQYLYFTKGISLISQVIYKTGCYMDNLLQPSPEVINFEFTSLKKMLKNAEKLFIDMGDSGAIMLRYCETFEDQLKNTEKVAKINKVKILKNSSTEEWSSKADELIKLGRNDKTIELLLTSTIDYDHYKSILKLKSRYSRLQNDMIAGIMTQEVIRTEESKITESILKVITLLKDED